MELYFQQKLLVGLNQKGTIIIKKYSLLLVTYHRFNKINETKLHNFRDFRKMIKNT